MVPKRVTQILVESEAGIVDSWAKRNGWTVNINLDRLEITAEVPHPKDNAPLFLHGDLSGYRAIPPAWRFVDESGNVTKAAFPAGRTGEWQIIDFPRQRRHLRTVQSTGLENCLWSSPGLG